MNKRFVLLYTGAPRQSGINNWEVFKQHINGDKHVIRNFAEISRIARAMHLALKTATWDDVERLLNEEWKLRRTNAPGITTPTHRQADCRCEKARRSRREGVRSRWWRLRDLADRRGHSRSRARVHPQERRPAARISDFAAWPSFLLPGERLFREVSMFTDSEGRLHPAWAFLLSALLSCLAFLVCAYFAAALAGDHILRFEAIFRTCLLAALLASFSWLLTVGNHVESPTAWPRRVLRWPQVGASSCLAGSGVGFVLVALAVVAVAIFGKLSFRLTLSAHGVARMALVLLVLLAGSLAEELMFRGYPFQRLVEAIGPGGAILVFSVLFGLVHWTNPGASFWGLLNTVVIGVVLSVAYLRTRALWLPWGFHFAWNATLGLVSSACPSAAFVFSMLSSTPPPSDRAGLPEAPTVWRPACREHWSFCWRC